MEDELLNEFVNNYKAQGIVKDKRTGTVYNPSAYNQSNQGVGDQVEDLNKYDEGLRLGMDQNANRAANQGGLKTLSNSLVQLATGIGGEAAKTVGYIGALTGGGEYGEMNDFAKLFVEDIGENLIEFGQELAPTYTNNEDLFNPLNHEWLSKTITNLGPTLGMMVGSLGTGIIAKGAGQIGKQVIKNSVKKAISKSAIKNIDKADNLFQLGVTSVISRNAEAMGQAKQLYDETIQKQRELHPEYSEEQIKQIANKAADDLYNKSMSLILIDILQYDEILKASRAITGGSTTRFIPQSVKKNKLFRAAQFMRQPIGEGLEEGLQFSFQQQVEDDLYAYNKDKSLAETFVDSLADKEMQESLIQGAIGGGIFQGVGKLYKRLVDKEAREQRRLERLQKLRKNKTTDESVAEEVEEEEEVEEPTELPKDNPFPDEEQVPDDNPFADLAEDIPQDNPLGDEVSLPSANPLENIETDRTPDDNPFDDQEAIPSDNPFEGMEEPLLMASPEDYDPNAAILAEAPPETWDTLQEEGIDTTGFTEDTKQNYIKVIQDKAKKISERKKAIKDLAKQDHDNDAAKVRAKVYSDVVNNRDDLSKDQKKRLLAPYQELLEDNKYSKDNIPNYDIFAEFADESLQNHLDQQKAQDVQLDVDITKISDKKLRELIPTLEDPTKAIEELKGRKNTKVNQRFLNKLEQTPLTQETKDELGIDPEKEIDNTLEKIVETLGSQIEVIEGDIDSYNYDTNTLVTTKDSTTRDKIVAIAKGLVASPKNNDLFKEVNDLLKDHDINLDFPAVINEIFSNREFAIDLMNTPLKSEPSKSMFTRILQKLAELLGISTPNLLEEVLSYLENINTKGLPINHSPEVLLGIRTNVVSPYKMATYNYKTRQVTHNRQVYPVIKSSKGSYIVVDGKRLYLDPAYKSGEYVPKEDDKYEDWTKVTLLLNENDQPVDNDHYSAEQKEDMKKPVTTSHLRVEIPKQDVTDFKTARIDLYSNDQYVGMLPGWYEDKPNEALLSLREKLYRQFKSGEQLDDIKFNYEQESVIRSNKKYSYEEVLPEGQKPKIGVITQVDEQIAEETGWPLLAKMIQFSPTNYKRYYGTSRPGTPVMYVKSNITGQEVPIPGDPVLFKNNQEAQDELFDAIHNSEENLEADIRAMVKWSTITKTNGFVMNHPVVKGEDFRRQNIHKATKEDKYLLEDNQDVRDYLKGDKEWKDIKQYLTINDGTLSEGYLTHPYSYFYRNQNIESRVVQLDRNKMNRESYLQEKSDYMKFQVSPRTIFKVPERVIYMADPQEVPQAIAKEEPDSLFETMDFDKEESKQLTEESKKEEGKAKEMNNLLNSLIQDPLNDPCKK